jgi:hypothetical protein
MTQPLLRLTLACALASAFAAPSRAQNFVKVTDPANPIVTNAAGPPGSFIGASWVDADGDHDLDLFVSGIGLFLNTGGGHFTQVAAPFNAQSGALGNSWADYDNDGDLDCFVAGGNTGSALYRNDGPGVFTKITTGIFSDSYSTAGWACAWGDYDGDGYADLVVAVPYGFGFNTSNHLLHNQGDGTFSLVTTSAVTAVTAPYTIPSWTDIDGDGDLDLSIGSGPANGTLAPDYLFLNHPETGPAAFTRYLTPPLGTDAHDGQLYNWIDFDNDGDLDVYLTNFGPPSGIPNELYRRDPGGFVKLTGADVGALVTDAGLSLASVWEDFDNDGDLDCYVTNGGPQPARYYRNEGAGPFTVVDFPGLTGAGPHWCATAGDFDGDGDLDLYVTGTATSHGLYRNDLANGYAWLDVDLAGSVSNRTALNARVHVRALIDGVPRWQMRELSSQNSFNGHDAYRLHFGLKNATIVDSVVVDWPAGGHSVRTQVPVKSRLEITEDLPTAVEVSLAGLQARTDRVSLAWYLTGDGFGGARVERSETGGAWVSLASVTPVGGFVRFEDRRVREGGRYGYRLAVTDGGEVRYAGETWVDVPSGFGIRAISPLPGRAGVTVSFALRSAAPARLELVDVSGRRVGAWNDGGSAGARTVTLAGGRTLGAGLYWARLTQDGVTDTRRIAVTD